MDESGIGVGMGLQLRAWSTEGERANVSAPLVRGVRVSTLTCIGARGVVLEAVVAGGVGAAEPPPSLGNQRVQVEPGHARTGNTMAST